MIASKPSCTVATPRQRNHATQAPTHATGHATGMQPRSLKALADKVLQRNRPCNSDATKAKNLCNFLPEKLPEKLQPVVALKELLEYQSMSMLSLEIDQGRITSWSIPEQYGPRDRAFVADLVAEANHKECLK